MAVRPTNKANATIWAGPLKAVVTGTVSAVTVEMFGHIQPGTTKTAAELREMALKMMQQKHEQLCAEGR